MKKILKKENVFLIFLIVYIFSFIIVKPVSNLDELWNYNMARAISEGLVPYKEVSMVITPLLSFINAIFLLILGNNLIIMRILASVLCATILYITFKIFLLLIKEIKISVIFTLLLGFLMVKDFCIDYNFFSLLLVLIILYLEIKKNDNQKGLLENLTKNKSNIAIGILAGCVILSKQTIGAILSFAVVIYPIFWVRNKNDFKIFLKIALQRILGIAIPIFILLIYLLVTGSLEDFISYTIFGVFTFSNKIPYSILLKEKLIIKLLAVVVPISVILMIVISIFAKKIKISTNFKILTIYSLVPLIIIYPISDQIHFLIGSYIVFIGILYLLFLILKWAIKKINFKSKNIVMYGLQIIICMVMFVCSVASIVENAIIYIESDKSSKNHGIKHYENLIIEPYLLDRIKEVDEFIVNQNGKKVYILDAEAAVYNIPLDIYNKDYDMFLLGNLGKDGVQGIIQRIEKEQETDDCIYLVRNPSYNYNWQTPMDVIHYVQNNLEKIGQVSIYDIYAYN